MHATSHAGFDAAMLLDRVRRVVGDFRLANGQPLAEAFASALAEDMRESGATSLDVQGLSHQAILDGAVDLVDALENGGPGALPFGTTIGGAEIGGVSIGGRTLVMDAGKHGLHPLETARRDAHGPNLALLRTLIVRKTRGLACRRIGLPNPAFVTEADSRHLLQFPPLAEAGGVMLQRWTAGSGAARFSAATPETLDAFATSIVADMRMLWKRRKEIAASAGELRGMVEAGIAQAEGAGRDVRLARMLVDLEGHREDDKLSFYLEYDGLDEALRPGTMLDYKDMVFDWDRRPLHRIPDTMEARAEDLEELRATGADGRIEDVAAAIARAAPEGAAAVLRRLSTDLETQVTLPGKAAPLYATLYWRDGTIRAEVAMPGVLNIDADRVELHAANLPAAVLCASVGRPLSDVVALPFDCDCLITEFDDLTGGGIRARLEIGTSPVNTATGESLPQSRPLEHG